MLDSVWVEFPYGRNDTGASVSSDRIKNSLKILLEKLLIFNYLLKKKDSIE